MRFYDCSKKFILFVDDEIWLLKWEEIWFRFWRAIWFGKNK